MIIEEFKKNNYVNYNMVYFMNKIKNKEYFSYSRFNDGELICAIKQIDNSLDSGPNKNCDNHEYIPSMGKELLKTLNNSDCNKYYIQFLYDWINDVKFSTYSELLIKKTLLNGIYQYSDFLQISMRNNPDEFKEFISVLNKNKVMVVGPSYLSKINLINYDTFIEVPTVNCYTDKINILNKIKSELTSDTIVLFSSSMATNIFIDDLFLEFGDDNFLIDVGSLWDIFFYETNREIKQRTPNLRKIDNFKNWYGEYFQ